MAILRYFGLAIVSLIVGTATLAYAFPLSGIPYEYAFGNFHPAQIGYPDVRMYVKMEPEKPTVAGEQIHLTVYRDDDNTPVADRIVIVMDKDGNIVSIPWTDENGEAVMSYPGEGAFIRVTSDGSYIRDAIIFLPVQERWVNATIMLYAGSVIAGIAAGIGLHLSIKMIHKRRSTSLQSRAGASP